VKGYGFVVVIGDSELKGGGVGDGTVETSVSVSHIESDRLGKRCSGEVEFTDEGSIDE